MTFTTLWACKRAYVKYHGAYPENFLDRVYSMLGVSSSWKICHLFSGILKPKKNEICVEIKNSGMDATKTRYPNESFDLVLADPPYDVQNAEVYGTKYPKIKDILREELRLTKKGGYFGLLHWLCPINPDPELCLRKAVIGITEGANMRIRVFCLFQKNF